VQSEQILDIANETLSYLRGGLDEKTAGEVCRLILAETEVAAVAITDTERILGFAGIGEDHHTTGGPILTQATRDALASDETRILQTREEIDCSKEYCLLSAAIVVPLHSRGRPAGTLKFYYTSPRQLNETQVTMVDGLARLLSTQLELAELDRQTELAREMELKALQAQIHPHFLFNTINTITSLIRTDPPKARELLKEFAALYRRSLQNPDELVTLDNELANVRSYFKLSQARFGERLLVTEDLDPRVLDAEVPAFIVQPLVENSVEHGMRAHGALSIRVEAGETGGRVFVRVTDDGVGIPAADLPRLLDPGFGKGLGIALANVDDRLKGHFGPGAGLKVESVEGEGTTVILDLAPSESPGEA
jgi:two-component system sensor histidine kinase LytS